MGPILLLFPWKLILGGHLPRGYKHRMLLGLLFAFSGNQLGRLTQDKGKGNLPLLQHRGLY